MKIFALHFVPATFTFSGVSDISPSSERIHCDARLMLEPLTLESLYSGRKLLYFSYQFC